MTSSSEHSFIVDLGRLSQRTPPIPFPPHSSVLHFFPVSLVLDLIPISFILDFFFPSDLSRILFVTYCICLLAAFHCLDFTFLCV